MTTLGLYGGPRGRNGTFAPKIIEEVVAALRGIFPFIANVGKMMQR